MKSLYLILFCVVHSYGMLESKSVLIQSIKDCDAEGFYTALTTYGYNIPNEEEKGQAALLVACDQLDELNQFGNSLQRCYGEFGLQEILQRIHQTSDKIGVTKEMIKTLIKHGAQVNDKNSEGKSAWDTIKYFEDLKELVNVQMID